MKRMATGHPFSLGATLVVLIGVLTSSVSALDCDTTCPFDGVGILAGCKPILDGVECQYNDTHYYPMFGGTC